MEPARKPATGLTIGFASLALVAIGFLVVFLSLPVSENSPSKDAAASEPVTILDQLPDPATRRAIEALRAVSPATYAELQTATLFAARDGAGQSTISQLVLQALFSQFAEQARALRSARGSDYQQVISGLAGGLKDLKSNESAWCDGPTLARFLSQNEQELLPSLLAEFPYQSPQYVWAMDWMATLLSVAKQAQDRPLRHARPGLRDEAILQQEGLALGSEQWALALQIAAFANSEGTSYGKMREVIAGMDVCDLGIAVETVSGRLPGDVRARIWADLLPEVMVGNTPYVIWRVTDYFFIG